jgi:ATP-dependent RNA helicase RhlE
MENKSWKNLRLENWIVSTCEKIGYKTPTDIQKSAIPPILKGKDVLSIELYS